MRRFVLVLVAGQLVGCRDAVQPTVSTEPAAADPVASAPYTLVDLGTLGGYTEAAAINDAGQVAGTGWTPSGTQHAFLWSAGEMRDQIGRAHV